MGLDGRHHLRRPAVDHADPVRDLQSQLLAGALDAVDGLAREPFADQRVIEVADQVDRDQAVGHGVGARLRLAEDLDLFGRECLAVEFHGPRLLEVRDLGRRQRPDVALELPHALAQALAQYREVRLRVQIDVAALVLLVTHFLDVELGLHVVLQLRDRIEQGPVAVDDREGAQRRTQVDLRLLPLAAPQQHDLLHAGHGVLESGLDQRFLGLRVAAEVDAHRLRVRVAAEPGQLVVDVLGEEGRKRRHREGQLVNRRVERAVGGDLVRGDVRAPEPRPVEADVPVREVLDELEQLRHHVVEAVAGHLLRDLRLHRLQLREHPAVQDVGALVEAPVRRPAVDAGVGAQESERVVPGQQRPAHHVAHAPVGEALVLAAHEAGVDEVQPQGVRAEALHQLAGRRVVAQALRHLLAVFGHHQAVDDDVAEGRTPVESRRKDGQRVEPAAGLVEPLGDELGGKALLEDPLVLERVVELRIRHGTRLEPAVEHFLHPVVGALLPLDLEGQRVHELPVQVLHTLARVALQLLDRTHADPVAGDAVLPDRQRRAPHPVARDGPVHGALEPVAEAAVLDVVRHPEDLRIRRDQVVDEVRHAHVPRGHGAVDERRVRAVAEGIWVFDDVPVVEGACLLQPGHDVGVGVLDEQPGEVRHVLREDPVHAHRADKRLDAVRAQHPVVVLAERRGLVDEARALVGGDVAVGDDDEGPLLRRVAEVGEEGLVRAPDELGALDLVQHLEGVAFRIDGNAFPRQVEDPATVLVAHPRVVDVRADADRQVRRQCPRGGGPRRQVCVLVGEPERHRDGRVLDIPIVHVGFEVRQRRLEGHRHRHHLEAAVHQALVPELFQDPPDRLHVPGVHGLVVVVEVDPAADAAHDGAPLVDVALDDLPALGVVAGDAELLHGLLCRHAELLVDLVLHRQAVTVPAEAAQHVAAAHRPVARHDVLDDRRQQVAVVRQPRRERRAVVEDVRLLVLRGLEGLPEDVVPVPERQDVVLHRHEGERPG